MILMILVSSTGFSMNMHFCGGELQELAFYSKAESCEKHIPALPPCHGESSDSATADDNDCCEDETLVSEAQEVNTKLSSIHELKPDLSFVALVVYYSAALVPDTEQANAFADTYLPPPLSRDIPLLVQSFLI